MFFNDKNEPHPVHLEGHAKHVPDVMIKIMLFYLLLAQDYYGLLFCTHIDVQKENGDRFAYQMKYPQFGMNEICGWLILRDNNESTLVLFSISDFERLCCKSIYSTRPMQFQWVGVFSHHISHKVVLNPVFTKHVCIKYKYRYK